PSPSLPDALPILTCRERSVTMGASVPTHGFPRAPAYSGEFTFHTVAPAGSSSLPVLCASAGYNRGTTRPRRPLRGRRRLAEGRTDAASGAPRRPEPSGRAQPARHRRRKAGADRRSGSAFSQGDGIESLARGRLG